MSNSNKAIAVVGEAEIIKVFGALGYDCFPATEPAQLVACCQKLVTEDYKIILILEKEAAKIPAYLNSRAGIAYPIFLPIPDTISQNHYGRQRLQQNLEKALGVKTGGTI